MEGPLGTMRLLVIDDDEMAARALEWALDDVGVEARTVSSARDVLQAIAALEPDAILLDVILDDTDGIALRKEVRKRWPRLPVVLTSGHFADFPGVREAVADRRTAFLQKPFEISTLIELIATLSKQ